MKQVKYQGGLQLADEISWQLADEISCTTILGPAWYFGKQGVNYFPFGD